MTTKELAREVFMDPHYLGKMLRRFRSEGDVYICAWDSESYPRALWMVGEGKDKPKPKAKTPAQIGQAYRERIKKNPEREIVYLAKKRLARMKPKTATWIPL